MKRSEFIKNLGLGSSGLMLPKELLNKTPVKIYDNYVSGLKHYQFSVVEKQVKEGDTLFVLRDPQNIYDAFAVSVYYQHYKLGYLPAYENIVVANMLDASVEISAYVSFFKQEKSPYKMETLGIALYAELITPTSNLVQQMKQSRANDMEDIYRKGYNL